LKYARGDFSSSDLITSKEFEEKEVSVKGGTTKLRVFDTGNQETFGSITRNTYADVDSVAIIFDVTNRRSFDAIDNYVKQVSNYNKDAVFVIVGNKVDLSTEREVDNEEPKEKCKELSKFGCQGYFETSASTGTGVGHMFTSLAEKTIDEQNSG